MSTSLPLVRNVCDYNWSFFFFLPSTNSVPRKSMRARDIIIIIILMHLCLFLRLLPCTGGGAVNNCTTDILRKDAPLHGMTAAQRRPSRVPISYYVLTYRVDIYGIGALTVLSNYFFFSSSSARDKL